MTIYNVAIRTIALVRADSEQEAINKFARLLDSRSLADWDTDTTVANAFESEPLDDERGVIG